MTRFTLETNIAADREVVFATLTDVERMPRWLIATEAIEDASGPIDVAGTTFVQKGAPGIRRPGATVASDPPERWHLRLVGMGERVDAVFTLAAGNTTTHVTLEMDVRNGPAIVGPVLERLGGWRLDRRQWQSSLKHLKAEAERLRVAPTSGALYSLQGGGWIRVGQVLDVDDRCVHLRLLSGVTKARPTSIDELGLDRRRPRDQFAIRTLDPALRSAAAFVMSGSEAALADGGFGLAHLPVTHRQFDNASPQLIGEVELPSDAADRVEAWQRRNGAAFGETPSPRTGAYFSVALQGMGLDAIGFGVVKVLHSQFRGVHLRSYSNIFVERPARIGEELLESRPLDLRLIERGEPLVNPPAMPHLALTHASFGNWKPEFVEMTVVDPEELIAYEEWKLAKGRYT